MARLSPLWRWLRWVLRLGPCSRVGDRRQGCANALRKVRRIIGRLRSLVDQGSPPQFVEWQRRIQTRRCGRGACECKGRSHSAVAAACMSSASCSGAGLMTCASMAGFSFFPALHYLPRNRRDDSLVESAHCRANVALTPRPKPRRSARSRCLAQRTRCLAK